MDTTTQLHSLRTAGVLPMLGWVVSVLAVAGMLFGAFVCAPGRRS